MSDVCYIGDDLVIMFPQAKDALGAPIDLTGGTLFCDLQTGAGSPVPASTTQIDSPGTAGTCRAFFSAADTAGLVPRAIYSYDGLVRLASGEVHTVGFGTFRAVARVTPNPT